MPSVDPKTGKVSLIPPARQLQRLGAMLLTLAISVGYTFDLHKIEYSLTKNPVLYKRMNSVVMLFTFASWFGASFWVSFVAGLVMFNNLPRHVFGKLQAKLFPAYFKYSLYMMVACLAATVFDAYIRLYLTGRGGPSYSKWDFAGVLNVLNMVDTNGYVVPYIEQYILSFVPFFKYVLLSEKAVQLHLGVLGCVCLNLYYLEPKTTAVMIQRHGFEKQIGTGHEVGLLRPVDPAVKAKYDAHTELPKINKKFGMLHGLSTSVNLISLCLGTAHVWSLSGEFAVGR